MNMEELIVAVQEWSKNKGLDKADSRGQMLKVTEESSEMGQAKALLLSPSKDIRNKGLEMYMDAVGDTYVTLIILAQQQGIEFLDLWEHADAFYSHDENDILVALGVISGHLAKNKSNSVEGIRFAIFKMILSLKHLATKEGLESSECLEMAYNVIAKRKGKMIDGVFVKEEDLKDGQ